MNAELMNSSQDSDVKQDNLKSSNDEEVASLQSEITLLKEHCAQEFALVHCELEEMMTVYPAEDLRSIFSRMEELQTDNEDLRRKLEPSLEHKNSSRLDFMEASIDDIGAEQYMLRKKIDSLSRQQIPSESGNGLVVAHHGQAVENLTTIARIFEDKIYKLEEDMLQITQAVSSVKNMTDRLCMDLPAPERERPFMWANPLFDDPEPSELDFGWTSDQSDWLTMEDEDSLSILGTPSITSTD